MLYKNCNFLLFWWSDKTDPKLSSQYLLGAIVWNCRNIRNINRKKSKVNSSVSLFPPVPARLPRSFILVFRYLVINNNILIFQCCKEISSPPKKRSRKSKSYKCEECDYVTENGPQRMLQHAKKSHGKFGLEPKRFKCDECDYANDEFCEVTRHKRRKHEASVQEVPKALELVKKFECDLCDFVGNELIKHREIEHLIFDHKEFEESKCYLKGTGQ